MSMNIVIILILLFTSANLEAFSGKITLNNGHSIKGDIRKTNDGGYWVTNRKGSVKFEKEEIKNIIVYSVKDNVSEKFIASMKITPGQPLQGGNSTKTNYDNLIAREAAKNCIDPELVKAVIKAESNFNMNDVSSKGACGLMQLMPETARLLGVKKIFSPEENIVAGTRFLRYMIDAFNGDIELGIAAYNAGCSAVKHYGRVPPYKETKNYVRNVLKNYRNNRGAGGISSYTDESGRLNMYNNK